jgi:hypothetical protein
MHLIVLAYLTAKNKGQEMVEKSPKKGYNFGDVFIANSWSKPKPD